MVSGRNVYIFQPNSSLRSQLKSRLWRNPTWTETLRLNRAGPLQRTPGTTAAVQQGKEAEPPLCWSNNNGISQFRINLNIFRKPIFFLNLMNLFKNDKMSFQGKPQWVPWFGGDRGKYSNLPCRAPQGAWTNQVWRPQILGPNRRYLCLTYWRQKPY